MINSLNTNINEQTRLGRSLSTITMGNTHLPAPIHLKMKLITACLDRHWWGRQYTRSIAAKRRNLLRALRAYPKWLHAQQNRGNIYIYIPCMPHTFIQHYEMFLVASFANIAEYEASTQNFDLQTNTQLLSGNNHLPK